MRWEFLYITFVLLLGCKPEKSQTTDLEVNTLYTLLLPTGFTPPDIPADNQLTEERVALGKLLFHDTRLSIDNSISCASCHLQSLAFADEVPFSFGINNAEGLRNAPSLANVAWQERLFADGGVPNLEMQVIAPLHDPVEMGHHIPDIVAQLKQDPTIQHMSQLAYGREFDTFVITRAIATFERTIISGQSRYDQYLYQGNEAALSQAEKNGMDLFFSEQTQCGNCHSGFMLSDMTFQNIGLYDEYEDIGRERISLDPMDNGKFKVPSLRNVGLTAPYMHDGSLETLEEVVLHFENGGVGHPNQSELIAPFELTEIERQDLIAFLNSLTDETLLSNSAYAP
jgi:cytochrome c peroxidase